MNCFFLNYLRYLIFNVTIIASNPNSSTFQNDLEVISLLFAIILPRFILRFSLSCRTFQVRYSQTATFY